MRTNPNIDMARRRYSDTLAAEVEAIRVAKALRAANEAAEAVLLKLIAAEHAAREMGA